jgi:hypothetical protein
VVKDKNGFLLVKILRKNAKAPIKVLIKSGKNMVVKKLKLKLLKN